MKRNKTMKGILFLLIAWVCIESLITTIVGMSDAKQAADYAVILGNKVNEDGTLSARLEARVLAGWDLFETGLVDTLIVSGGLGKEGYDEAKKMADYLIEKGVPPSLIITDSQGNNSLLTAQNAAQRIPTTASVIVVSQFFHIRRCKLIFRKVGFEQVQGTHASYFELRDLYALAREFPALYKYRLLH